MDGDEWDLRDLLVERLRADGHDVRTAGSAAAALTAVTPPPVASLTLVERLRADGHDVRAAGSAAAALTAVTPPPAASLTTFRRAHRSSTCAGTGSGSRSGTGG